MSRAPRAVWIDTDAAIGVPRADVDDALALVQAFHSPELEVRGVSAVYGNAPLAETFPIAAEIAKRFGPGGLPVARGAAGAEDLGAESEAVAALADALRAGPLTVLAIGPLTNVASLVLRHPELAERIEAIAMVAARRPGQRFVSVPSQPRPFPDLNFDCDPEAVRALLETPIEIVFTPWEVSSHVWIDDGDLEGLARAGGSGAWLASRCRDWLAMWRRDLGAPGFNPFDTLAVAWASHPELLEHFRGGVWIEDGPDDASPPGEGTPDGRKPHLLVEPGRPGRQAIYCHRPKPAFKPLLLERLAGAQRAEGERRRSPAGGS